MAIFFFLVPLLLLLVIIPPSFSIPATNVTLEHLDPTLPPVLTGPQPKCSVLALHHKFAHTLGLPPVSANYTHPAGCPAPWTRVVLELTGVASDAQKDRIAAVWIDGVEVLRTTTPLATAPGTVWTVQKDVTRYTTAIRRLTEGDGIVSMMLRNSNTTLPGAYSVNITLHFYRGALSTTVVKATAVAPQRYTSLPTVKGLYREPADVIIPISNENGYCCSEGFWLKISNGSHIPTAQVTIPRNAYRAVLEIFTSYHDRDETWYTNPLRSEYDSGGGSNGGFRQVYATVSL